MLVIIYSKLLILDVRQKDTKSYRPPLFFLSPLFLLLDGGELATVAARLARGAAVQHLLLLPKLLAKSSLVVSLT